MTKPPSNSDFLELLGRASMRVLRSNLEPLLKELAEDEQAAPTDAKPSDIETTGEPEDVPELTDEEIEAQCAALRERLKARKGGA